MPNWCANIATFVHDDPQQIKRLRAAIENETMFSEFVPNPNGQGSEDWYEHNTNFWGTKWDTGGDITKVTKKRLMCSFDTAWSPPLQFYDAMKEQGWTITAEFYEPGMAFVGEYDSDVGGTSYDIPDNLEDLMEDVPLHLVESWNLDSNFEDEEDS